jgi:hypothetical protein
LHALNFKLCSILRPREFPRNVLTSSVAEAVSISTRATNISWK